jgi:hypothetical protein
MRTALSLLVLSLLILAGVWLLTPAVGVGQAPAPGAPVAPPRPPAVGAPAKEKKGAAAPAAGKEAQAEGLEQLIAEALKSNPDIRVADSRVREAEAEAQRVRLKVIADLSVLHAALEGARIAVDGALAAVKRAEQLRKQNVVSQEDVEATRLAYAKSKAELASAEAKLPYLLGRLPGDKDRSELIDDLIRKKWLDSPATPARSAEEAMRFLLLEAQGKATAAEEIQKNLGLPTKDAPAYPSALAEKVIKALDTPIRADFEQATLTDALQFLRDKALPGVNLLWRDSVKDVAVTVKMDVPVPVGAILQYLEDSHGLVFVLRDYGIVVVPDERPLPPGAERVTELWKRSKAREQVLNEKTAP